MFLFFFSSCFCFLFSFSFSFPFSFFQSLLPVVIGTSGGRLIVRLRTTSSSVIQSFYLTRKIASEEIHLSSSCHQLHDARTLDAISKWSQQNFHLLYCLPYADVRCFLSFLLPCFQPIGGAKCLSRCIFHLHLRHKNPYSVEKSPTFFGQSPLSMDHSTRFMALIFRNCLSSSVRNRNYSPCLLLFSL